MEHGTPIKRHSNSTRQGDRLALDAYRDMAKLYRGGSDPSITDEISKYLRAAQITLITNSDDLNERLLDAARDPSGNGGGGHSDIIRVLNSISLCFVETLNHHIGSKHKAIIFVSTPDHPIPEDDMSTDIRPDWYAYMATYDVLRASVRDNVAPLPGSYYSIIGIGEQVSGGSDSNGKVMRYLQILYQYRYDLQTVYGFQYRHRSHEGRHWSFNACGWARSDWSESDPASTTNEGSKKGEREAEVQGDPLLPWVQHVLLLYSSDYFRIGYITRGGHVGVNKWTVEGKTFVVVPFHTSSGPGRMTIVFLILSYHNANVITGILKRQWRDKRGRFIEGNLMSLAQSIRWYPCFPVPSYVGPIGAYEILQRSGSDIERQLSLLEMKTLGYPLTSCKNTLELLMVGYDAILAHWLLYKKCGILHRDVSENNVLCKPKHLLTEAELQDKKEREQDFRKPIMEVLGRSRGEWCALLTDFDQAVIHEEWEGDSHQKRLERTGTPMFIAVEKSSDEERVIPNRDYEDLNALSTKLLYVETHHQTIFKQAFPCQEENATFDANWRAVLGNERNRIEKAFDSIFTGSAMLDPQRSHKAYHDVESFFWVFLWSFVRAQPEGHDSAQNKSYGRFCDAMLRHQVAEEDNRFDYLFNAKGRLDNIFHPALKRFAELFTSMAEYLSVPWSRHERIINLQDDHAHLAMLRLLLGAILEEGKLESPTLLSNKVRYFESEFPSKEVRSSSKSKSKSQSIPYTQAMELGTIPELGDVQSSTFNAFGIGAEKPSAAPDKPNDVTGPPISLAYTSSFTGDVSGNPGDAANTATAEQVKTLEPLPPNPQEFLDQYFIFEHKRTRGLPDKDLTKTFASGCQQSNSEGPSVLNEDPFIHNNAPGLGYKRQVGPRDENHGENRSERPSKKTKSAE